MKRSEVRIAIEKTIAKLGEKGITLPMFGYWKIDDWKKRKEQLGTIRQTKLGWDVTDWGQGDFAHMGAVLFTVRNGVLGKPEIGTPYAEKYIVMEDGQELPLHFHFDKVEDIINRVGGILKIQVYNSLENGELDLVNDVEVEMDGIKSMVPAGSFVEVPVGCSITIRPGMYHLFHAEGDLIVGEVSAVNDDETDNRFAAKLPRFTTIDEDEAVIYPLCNELETLVFGE